MNNLILLLQKEKKDLQFLTFQQVHFLALVHITLVLKDHSQVQDQIHCIQYEHFPTSHTKFQFSPSLPLPLCMWRCPKDHFMQLVLVNLFLTTLTEKQHIMLLFVLSRIPLMDYNQRKILLKVYHCSLFSLEYKQEIQVSFYRRVKVRYLIYTFQAQQQNVRLLIENKYKSYKEKSSYFQITCHKRTIKLLSNKTPCIASCN